MPAVTFKSWETGMKKVAFTKMLMYTANLTLLEAKQITDDLLEGKETALKTETIEKANWIALEATDLGVICIMSKEG
jgi:hypothetical protein